MAYKGNYRFEHIIHNPIYKFSLQNNTCLHKLKTILYQQLSALVFTSLHTCIYKFKHIAILFTLHSHRYLFAEEKFKT